MITQQRLKSVLNYDPDSGLFTWAISVGSVKSGDTAGSKHSNGYANIKIDRNTYFAHRLAWLYVNGSFPSNFIDHINGDKTDNRIANLCQCTASENLQNQGMFRSTESRLIGVHRDKSGTRWCAQIRAHNKKYHLGTFTTPEEASNAYLMAKAKLHTYRQAPRDNTRPRPHHFDQIGN